MWRNISDLSNTDLREFESSFHFVIDPIFREFLLSHNNGIPGNAEIQTQTRKRQIGRIYDFSRTADATAWKINTRLRPVIGDKRIIIGEDITGNFICLNRHYRHQYLSVWSHVQNNFEECILDIPTLLKYIN